MKIHEVQGKGPRGGDLLLFQCPGCGNGHPFEINCPDGKGWTWNGSSDKPTFNPSLLILAPSPRCHSFVRDGKIEFLSDCEHSLAGKTVELPEW